MTQVVDRVNFVLTFSVMLAMAIPLLLFPEASALTSNGLQLPRY